MSYSKINVDTCSVENEESEASDEEKTTGSVAKSHYSILQNIVISLKKFGENKINVDAAAAVNENVQILVCGPTRVGKSTLIKAITGRDVHTSSSLNPDTEYATSYKYEDGKVIFWDTKGFETWNTSSLDKFWNEHFGVKRILPVFCLFCVGTGASADTNLISYMFEKYLFRYSIPVCWVITKSGVTDVAQTKAYIDEGVKLLGKVKEVIKKNIAWETEKGFIIRINSIESVISPPRQKAVRIKRFGLYTLLNIIINNISLSSQEHLMTLYKENESYLSYLAAGLFETAYKLGFPVLDCLEEDKRELFKKVSGNKIPVEVISQAFFRNIKMISRMIDYKK